MRLRLRAILVVSATVLVFATIVLMWLPRHRGGPSPPATVAPPMPDREAPVAAPSAPVGQSSGRTGRTPITGAPATTRPQATAPSRAVPAPPTSGRAESKPAAKPDSVRIEPIPPAAMPDTGAPRSPALIEPVAPLPGMIAIPEPTIPPPARVFEEESVSLAQVLGRYEQAYDNLDASATAAIWPSVDVRALTRAFARLENQDLQLRNCVFAVSANDAAARCAGVLHYARRVGDRTPKIERHVWTIEFVRAGATWQIVRVTAQ
jgi:hypothetical protein